MLDETKFKEKALKKAKEYFENVHMTDEQYKIFIDFIQQIHKYISIGEDALKGFAWQAIGMWQKDYNMDFIVIAIKSHEERMKAITQICDYLKIELAQNLINSEYESLVTKAVDETEAYYNEKYANI